MNNTSTLAVPSRTAVLSALDKLLADEFLLYTKTRNFHWNVTGPNFMELHKLFEAQYAALSEAVDAVAERSRALGGRARGSMKEFLALARLKESSGATPSASAMLSELGKDHEALIAALRKDIETAEKAKDAGTADFLTGLLEDHEKTAWMLRSYR